MIAVFDALGWSTGYVLGASMGGMVAQATAVHHPDRVRGLISLSSAPSPSFRVNRPHLGVMFRMLRIMGRKCADRDAEEQRWVDVFSGIAGSPIGPADQEDWREGGRLTYDRGRNPAGDLRHFAAIRAAGDRRRELSGVRAPTLVLHGEADRMTSPRAGRATADAIPGARFVSYPGLGHGLPRAFWPAILDEISALAARTEGATAER